MSDTIGLVHAYPRRAEAEALAAVTPSLKRMKAAILLAVGAAGEHGLIPDEFPGLINTVRRRFTDLWILGLIKPTDRMRPNKRGRNETVWVLGKDEHRLLRQREKPREKIKRLEAELYAVRSAAANLSGYAASVRYDQNQAEWVAGLLQRAEAMQKLLKMA